MIHEVDEGLRLLMAAEGIPADGVELVFDAPTKEWAERRNAPTISVFLYDLREDLTRRRTGLLREHSEDGEVIGWRNPPHWYQLSYLVTAWTARPQDEHRLLADVLRGMGKHDALTGSLLTGTLAELGMAVNFRAAVPIAEERTATDIFTALGGRLKAAVNLEVIAPMPGDERPAGPPVTEGILVRSGNGDGPRRLRYTGRNPAEGTGFAAERPRPEAGSRRRWGPQP